MRLFIAIPLEEHVKAGVSAVQDAFRKRFVTGNYVPEESFHVTLAFIGEYADIERVLEALEQVRFRPFSLKMNKIGCFGDLWWTGFEKNQALENLAEKVRHALSEAGIPFDGKRFRAHVTFLRNPHYAVGAPPENVSVGTAEMTVDRFSLMSSVRRKNGMVYTEIGEIEAEA